MDAATAPAPVEVVGSPTPPARWSVGTLTYTLHGLIVLFGLLLLGDFAYALRERSVVPISQVMLRQYHASDLTTSLIYGAIPAFLTVLIWPVVSVWSDRTRTRWGRRIPFLFWPTPLVCLALVGLAYAADLGTALHARLGLPVPVESCIIGVFAGFWILFEVFALVASNLFTALVADVVPSAVIGRFFALFRMVSLGAGILFNYGLLAQAEHHATALFLGLAVVYFAGFTTMCLLVREGAYPPPPTITGTLGARIGVTVRETVRAPFYVLAFLTMAVVSLGFMPGNLFMFSMAQSYALDLDQFGKAQALIYAIGILLSFPTGWLCDRFHPLYVAFACLAVFCGINLIALGAVTDAASYRAVFIGTSLAGGLYLTASASLLPRIYPRLQFSQFYAATHVVINLCACVGTPLMGGLMDVSGHDYRLVYVVSAGLSGLGLGLWLWLIHHFRRQGGTRAYRAP
jgi:maltose/moltooligosaccharide transporter